ncbi:MAG: hypothetical protein KA007_02670 [Candidatus Pacebacteria bacterium]|nr:hypothetical protein [Candidatus Paceibacterota bacterium]
MPPAREPVIGKRANFLGRKNSTGMCTRKNIKPNVIGETPNVNNPPRKHMS